MTSPRAYRLGIDLGTTYTAAVVCRRQGPGDGWSEPEIVALGTRSASVASVLYLGEDGAVLVGEAAERRGLTEPDRVVHQFKRRIGDDVPLVVGSAVHTAHDLAARLARWVVDRVAEREGGPADAVAVTHPAAWGGHKLELLAGALRRVGLDDVTFLPEPQAAAVAYSARQRVDAGGVVAVYDLGGGTFDAAVVRRTAAGFELPGRAEGIEQLGGVDFDDRVFDHVRDGIGAALDELDVSDPDVLAAVARLRRECVEAKEALSFDTQATIPVMLPGVRTTIRLTRVEFEAAIRGSIDHTVDALRRTVDSAGLSPEALQAVLLVGGSSRIPLIAQRISEELGRPVAVDSDPKTSIATGAALTIAPRPAPASGTAPVTNPAPVPTPAAPDADAASSGMLDLGALASRSSAAPSSPSSPVAPGPAAAVAAPERPRPEAPSGPRPEFVAGPRAEAIAAPARPPVGTRAGGQQDAAEDEARPNVRRIVVIVVLCALVLFGAAFGVGLWMKLQQQGSTPASAPVRSALTPSPTSGPTLLARN
ncbi:Hsp70 family protein [Actinomycetospora termitidis]|uniref:Hsp70 family protein n=1 Tax=Actinomycetospora termitidis TaxID=3053470 RepID=A0ABT7M1P0_9PSEU|nr:Hsp70 family protein [Actinomycetospora sp. Odt1-22]MDL5154376.1 Hsp70 family protein [Actinomycetospora sp. Odt1-22]